MIEPETPEKRYDWIGWLTLAALWALLLNQLRVEWSINPHYRYGWGIPPLAAYLFWKRWECRPEPAPPRRLRWGAALFALFALLWAPARLIQEANPDWRLVSWALASLVVGWTFLSLWVQGGRPWLRHFFVPVAFVLLAVPWPSQFETRVVQGLMEGIAGVTVRLVNWMGIPAAQSGNLIQLPAGAVGIDEACSGIRSLQATLMVSIFLGELYRLSWRWRAILVGGGLGLGLLFNLVRTTLLTWLSARQGGEAIEEWHDPAGLTILIATLICLWALAAAVQPAHGRPQASGGGRERGGFPVKWIAALGAWLMVVEAGTDAWYRAHENDRPFATTWRLKWPEGESGFQFEPFPETPRAMLRFSDGQAARWLRDDGARWFIYFMRWAPGRAAPQLARQHRPEICLPATGARMTKDWGTRVLSAGDLELPFRVQTFVGSRSLFYVFYCLWEERVDRSPQDDGFDRFERLRAVWEGRRHLGQKVLEIAIFGSPSLEQAEAGVERFLEEHLVVGPSRSGRRRGEGGAVVADRAFESAGAPHQGADSRWRGESSSALVYEWAFFRSIGAPEEFGEADFGFDAPELRRDKHTGKAAAVYR